MNEEQVLIARLQDLAKRAYRQNIYTYTGFLTPAELAVVYEKQADFSFVGMTCFGGTPECERQMVQFGSEELFGYAGVFPISIILVEPLLDKFAEDLSHRDFLGALMNLGIERSVLGDILVKDGKRAYIFCQENIAAYIMEQLTKIKHTNVKTSLVEGEIEDLKPDQQVMMELYPEIYSCIGCNACTKACTQNLNVMQYIAYAQRGELEKCAEESFDCVGCGCCSVRCPAGISHPMVGLLARRLTGKYIEPESKHLTKRVEEIHEGRYDALIEQIMQKPITEMEELYNTREIEK